MLGIGFNFRQMQEISSPQCPDRFWGPPSLYPKGTGGSFPLIQRPGSEVDHSPTSRAEVKNA
jgi:hypothetical protein